MRENSRDIRSRNILVILYLGDPCFSSMDLEMPREWATPLFRETRYFFTFNSPFLGEKCMKWFEIFRGHMKKKQPKLLRSLKQFK